MNQDREDLFELEEDTQKGKYLIFSIDSEEYGIEIRFVTEIIGIQQITEIPELPYYLKGVINLRGKIIPVMDVKLKFKKEETKYDDRTCIVVVDVNEITIGLIIDRVSEVVDIGDDKISEPPNINRSDKNKYIKGIGKLGDKVKLLLDCEAILGSDSENLAGVI